MSEGSPADSPYASPQSTDAPAEQPGAVVASPDDRMWAMLGHLAGLLGWAALGIGQIVVPLVLYLMYKDKSKFVAFHALQSLFFQIAVHVIYVVAGIIGTTCVGLVVAIPVMILVAIADLVLIIIAAIKSYNGEWYEYPWIGRYARQQVGI